MVIDCGTCAVAGDACNDCVVSVLLGPPGLAFSPEIADEHRAAVEALAGSGLVPPLRLVPPAPATCTGRHRAS
ncbi:unannotated protein [freshwater metagenome]|uniref:Unannotated protein n=1 Tax=freshwater metagenome TaxID=449393 RepID=A0A6J7CLQ3_9ZZZZ